MTANNNTNRLTLKQIDGEITTFTTSRKALETHGHNIAMMILRHAAPAEVNADCSGSGDCTRALKLAQAMPKSWCAGLEEWFKLFSPIRVVTKNGKCEFDPAYKKLSKDEKLTWWKLEDAAMTSFIDLEPDMNSNAKPLDLAALLKLLERQADGLDKKAEDGKIVDHDVAIAVQMAAELRKLAAKKWSRKAKAATANDTTTKTDKPATGNAQTSETGTVRTLKANSATAKKAAERKAA
jgi:hypothetical protein